MLRDCLAAFRRRIYAATVLLRRAPFPMKAWLQWL
jgi:hypothetical protein